MENLEMMLISGVIKFAVFCAAIGPFTGLVIGVSALPAWAAAREESKLSAQLWGGLLVIGTVLGPGMWFLMPHLLRFYGYEGGFPSWHLLAQAAGVGIGVIGVIMWGRVMTPKLTKMMGKATKRTDMERNRKTDVREIAKHLPDPRQDFNPSQYLDSKKGVFFGLNEQRQAQYIPQDLWRRSHVQLIGTSGAGKGVAAAVMLTQALRDGEAVVVIDPKDDEWAPHVLKSEAERLGVPFNLVDLRADIPQIDLFDGASSDQLEELLVAGFSLAEKGEAADFYRIADRQAARLAGSLLNELGELVTPAMLAEHPDIRKKGREAAGFLGKLDELARVQALNAPGARHMSATVAGGGCLYIIGSMRNERIKSAQRMALVRLLQLVETRDRINSKPRPVCVFLDELKYHLSRPALEGLGAARDKGMHLVLAHQSLADLRDCPADLDGEAVVGAVVENCAIRVTYRVRDPETAEWLASMSGTILVDDETRRVDRNLALAEVMDSDRTVRQAERYLIDQNMLLNLPSRVAVIYGGALPVFAHICPLPAVKGQLHLAAAPAADIDGDSPTPEPTLPDRLEDLPSVDI